MQRVQVHGDALPQEAVRPQLPLHLGDVVPGRASSAAACRRSAAARPAAGRLRRSRARRPAVREQPEVAGCGSACSSPARRGRRTGTGQQDARPVPVLLGPVGDDLRQRRPVHPLADQHVIGRRTRAARRCRGRRRRRRRTRAGRGLQLVVEFLGHPVAQLVEQRLDVQAGHKDAEQPPDPASWVKSLIGARPAPGYWILTATAAVQPDGPVHLADRGGGRRACRRRFCERLPPVGAQVGGEHPVHRATGSGGADPAAWSASPGTARRSRAAARPRRSTAPGPASCPALELTEHPEDLVGRALLYLLRDQLGGSPPDPLADAERGAARRPPPAAWPALPSGSPGSWARRSHSLLSRMASADDG